MKAKFRIMLALLVLGTASLAGCATSKEVREIVAKSNAAMVDVPSFELVRDSSDLDKWKEPVARIERLVTQHPDQPELVSALRVRQALLLTVYGQYATADTAWSKVENPKHLGPRDRALYELRSDLVWWFERAGEPEFGKDQIPRASGALSRFTTTCDGLQEGSDIRFYLEVMRAQIALKAANSVSTFNNIKQKQQVEADLVAHLKRLAERYDVADQKWITDHGSKAISASSQPLERLRARVWLIEVARKYRQVAADKELKPQWEPAWISTVAPD